MTDYAFLTTNPVTVSHDDLYAGPPGTTPDPDGAADHGPATTATADDARRRPQPPTAPPTPGPGHQPRFRRRRDRRATRCPPARSSSPPTAATPMPAPRLAPLRTVIGGGAEDPVQRCRHDRAPRRRLPRVGQGRVQPVRHHSELSRRGGLVRRIGARHQLAASGSTLGQPRGWTAEFSSAMGGDAAFKNQFLGTNKMAADPDQVFIDGAALKQVGHRRRGRGGHVRRERRRRHPHHRLRPDRQAGPGQRSGSRRSSCPARTPWSGASACAGTPTPTRPRAPSGSSTPAAPSQCRRRGRRHLRHDGVQPGQDHRPRDRATGRDDGPRRQPDRQLHDHATRSSATTTPKASRQSRKPAG